MYEYYTPQGQAATRMVIAVLASPLGRVRFVEPECCTAVRYMDLLALDIQLGN